MTTAIQPGVRPELKGSILLVCSGNICRSPVAAAMLEQALDPFPVTVLSAGLIARDGLPVQPKMLAAVEPYVELERFDPFTSQRVSKEMLAEADLVLTATRNQRADLVRFSPAVVRNAFTLLEFAELATDLARHLASVDESKPHTISDFVSLVPVVRGTRRITTSMDVSDPMGRSGRAHIKVARQIHVAVGAISAALRP